MIALEMFNLTLNFVYIWVLSKQGWQYLYIKSTKKAELKQSRWSLIGLINCTLYSYIPPHKYDILLEGNNDKASYRTNPLQLKKL